MSGAAGVVVVGAGLAGLSAAAMLGRAGQRVILLERAHEPGGRASTRETQGFFLNRGAHALYRGGPAWRVLHELGVVPRGGVPDGKGGFALKQGELHTLPAGPASLLTTGLFGLREKLEMARLLGSFTSIDASGLDGVRLADWLASEVKTPGVAAFLATLFRLSTYVGELDELSASAAIRQLQLSLTQGVMYLDRGWGTLVEGLRRAAIEAGVEVRTGARADAIAIEGGAARGVRLAGGERIGCEAVIVAATPAVARGLVPSCRALREADERAVPVRAACLDVALSALPRPATRVVLGVDRPVYCAVHTAYARLAPEGGAMVHAVLYRPSGDPRADERELEGVLDRAQPGWRAALVERQYLPSITVMNARPDAAPGGLAGRPDVDAAGIDGLYLAGDWVGPEGMLVDASFASAARAAARVIARAPARATHEATAT